MNKCFRIFILILYCVVSTIYLAYLFRGYLNNTTKIHESSHSTRIAEPAASVTFQNDSICKGCYDTKIRGLDQLKLGFAVKPEFQKLPNSWQHILFEAKHKIPQKPQRPRPREVKTILIYGAPRWLNYANPSDSPRNINPEFECKYVNWEPHTNTTSGNINISSSIETFARKSDAVVVPVARDLDPRMLRAIYGSEFPIYYDQVHGEYKRTVAIATPKLIHLTFESPSMRYNSFDIKINGVDRPRDLLASYWRGSDIYIPYFRWRYFDNKVRSIPQAKNYAQGRSKMAAIVMSNCVSDNDRHGLVIQIQKYIKVDIYGRCGVYMECITWDCFPHIKENYKFYLAFENSNCRDYITEKLYKNAFRNDLLPIVYGAHPSDYKAIAPENSYIHFEDFESVEKLGDYLGMLDKNDTLYNSYFRWKGTGNFSETDKEDSTLSEVCAYLHADELTGGTNAVSESDRKQKHGTKSENTEETVILPYLNKRDTYNFTAFYWSEDDKRLCLAYRANYWNK